MRKEKWFFMALAISLLTACSNDVANPNCGDLVCTENQKCVDLVKCVDLCGEDICSDGQQCVENTCKDACGDTFCEETQKCVENQCIDLCGKDICKDGQQCVENTCKDACGETFCTETQKCVENACKDLCGKDVCKDGQQCVDNACQDPCGETFCTSKQKCVENECKDLCGNDICTSEQTCIDGTCANNDACADVECGSNEICNPLTKQCQACLTDAHCVEKTPDKPFCIQGSCYECNEPGNKEQCVTDEAKAICDAESHECRKCEKDDECKTRFDDKPFCDTSDGKCVEILGCKSGDECDSGVCINKICRECDETHPCSNGKVCETQGENANMCVSCDDQHACPSPLVCSVDGICVECNTPQECTENVGHPACATTGIHANTCVECTSNDDCTDAAKPICLLEGEEINICIECLTYADCRDGKVCDPTNHQCVDCNETDHLCPTGAYCSPETNSCVDCYKDEQCRMGYCINNTCIECESSDDCSEMETSNVCSDLYKCEDCNEETNCKDGKCKEGICHKVCQTGTLCGTNIENETCCTGTEKCIYGKCVTPGTDCSSDSECAIWDKCDETTQSCIPLETDPEECVYMPTIPAFEAEQQWEYVHTGAATSFDSSVVGVPVVANLTDDNGDGKVDENDIPEVMFVAVDGSLTVRSGDTGQELATNRDMKFNYLTDMAVADVDNDGKNELLVTSGDTDSNTVGLYAYTLEKQADNSYKLVKKYFLKASGFSYATPGMGGGYYADLHPTVADIDADGTPDIITTKGILKGNDWSKWKCNFTLPGSNWYYNLFAVADLDQDGKMEIIDRAIYNTECTQIAPAPDSNNWRYTAVADILPDENNPSYPGELVPEIVRTRESGYVSVWKVYLNNGVWSQRKIWDTYLTGGGAGNPNIADFNGDGKPEIGVAGKSYYALFNGQTGAIIWKSSTYDESGATGSSVFDFESDGKAEVVYRDQNKLRVYDGSDGRIIWETTCRSNTVIEYPIIVDVDNDGHAEIIAGCRKDQTNGLTVFQGVGNQWVPTRRIWNQHSYHITNINEDGSVPKQEEANWLNKRYNNYRQNVLAEGIYNAPNFVPGFLAENKDSCSSQPVTIGLQATLTNKGKLSVDDEVQVSFYIEDYDYNGNNVKAYIGTTPVQGLKIDEQKTVTYLWDMKTAYVRDEAGNLVKVEIENAAGLKIFFTVDDAANTGNAQFNECNEEDNELKASRVITLSGC